MAPVVTMTCMTTKNKFDVENPTVVVLSNGRYAYKEKCPWTGKNDKELFASKFCSATAYEEYLQSAPETRQVGRRSTLQSSKMTGRANRKLTNSKWVAIGYAGVAGRRVELCHEQQTWPSQSGQTHCAVSNTLEGFHPW